MTNEQERPAKPKGSRVKTSGIVLFCMGIAGVIICLLMVWMGISNDIEDSGPAFIGFFGLIVSFLVLVLGATLYFIGKRQAKKQKNQNIPPA